MTSQEHLPCTRQYLCLAFQNLCDNIASLQTYNVLMLIDKELNILRQIHIDAYLKMQQRCDCCRCGRTCKPLQIHKQERPYTRLLLQQFRATNNPQEKQKLWAEVQKIQSNGARLYGTL